MPRSEHRRPSAAHVKAKHGAPTTVVDYPIWFPAKAPWWVRVVDWWHSRKAQWHSKGVTR